MALLTYSPSEVNVSIAALYFIDGFVDGSFVTITKDEQNFQYQKAIDGNIARLLRKDDTYTVSLSLAQTSAANDMLTLIHTVDLKTGLGKFPLFIKDGSGSSLFFATNCWIEKLPDLVFTTGIEARVWSIKCSFAAMTVGGNSDSTLSDILGIGSLALTGLGAAGVI